MPAGQITSTTSSGTLVLDLVLIKLLKLTSSGTDQITKTNTSSATDQIT